MNKKIVLFLICSSLLLGVNSCDKKNESEKSQTSSVSVSEDSSDASENNTKKDNKSNKDSKNKDSKKPAESKTPDVSGEKDHVNPENNNNQSQDGDMVQAVSSATMFKTGVWAATDGIESFSYYFFDSQNQSGRQENMLSHQGNTFTYTFEDGYVVFDQTSMHEIDKNVVTLISDTEGMISWPNGRVETLTFVSPDIDNFKYYSNFELEDAAQKYYTKDMTEEESYKYMVQSSNESGENVRIEIYTFENDSKNIQMVYNVSRSSGKGTDNSGNDINLVS